MSRSLMDCMICKVIGRQALGEWEIPWFLWIPFGRSCRRGGNWLLNCACSPADTCMCRMAEM